MLGSGGCSGDGVWGWDLLPGMLWVGLRKITSEPIFGEMGFSPYLSMSRRSLCADRVGRGDRGAFPTAQRSAGTPRPRASRGEGSRRLCVIRYFVRKKQKAQDFLDIPSQSTLTNTFHGGKDLPRVGIF